MEKLIHGLEIDTLKSIEGNYLYVHYSDKNLEIRSKYPIEEILDHNISKKKLPGNLGMYVYPEDSIICYTNNNKITKSSFNTILKEEKCINRRSSIKNIILDVPVVLEQEDDENEEIEEDEEEDEDCDEISDIEEDENVDWENEDDEEFDFQEPIVE